MKKKSLKAVLSVVLSTIIVFSMSQTVFAATSTDVVLSVNKPGAGTVNATSLNVRANPSTSADIIGSLSNGTKVMLVARTSSGGTDWYRVLFYKASTGQYLYGYVSRNYVNESSLNYYTAVHTDGGNLNLRSGPSTNSGTIVSLSNGTVVPEYDYSGTWSHVLYATREGYLNGLYIVRTHY